jgi:hypothetical protein
MNISVSGFHIVEIFHVMFKKTNWKFKTLIQDSYVLCLSPERVISCSKNMKTSH